MNLLNPDSSYLHQPPTAILTISVGLGKEEDRSVSAFPAVIGRGSTADVRVEDGLVSRTHCLLEMRKGDLFLRDLESLNGTFVNTHRVNSVRLCLGDEKSASVRRGSSWPNCRASQPKPLPDRKEVTPHDVLRLSIARNSCRIMRKA